jgi:hypothetical protein
MSPGNAERRPGGGAVRSSGLLADEATSKVAHELRRRRDAADRSVPLWCGHRDPLDHASFPPSRRAILLAREHLRGLGLDSVLTESILSDLWVRSGGTARGYEREARACQGARPLTVAAAHLGGQS